MGAALLAPVPPLALALSRRHWACRQRSSTITIDDDQDQQ
jgi:hypothetical protein